MATDAVAKRLYDKLYSNDPVIEPRILHGRLRQNLHEIQKNIEAGKFTTSTIDILPLPHFNVNSMYNSQFCALHENGDHLFMVNQDHGWINQSGLCFLKQFSIVAEGITRSRSRKRKLIEAEPIFLPEDFVAGDHHVIVGTFNKFVAICNMSGQQMKAVIYKWDSGQKMRVQKLELDPDYLNTRCSYIRNGHLILESTHNQNTRKVKILIWTFVEDEFQVAAKLGRRRMDSI
jgi:hypothetical protein